MNLKLIGLIIGAIMVLEGIPYFLLPNTLKKLFLQIIQLDSRLLRFMGFTFIILVLLIVYLLKSTV
jgi:uncharacterized protein YjeT (DUF2065 family)